MNIINNYYNTYKNTDDIDRKKYFKAVLSEILVNKKYSGIILENWDRIVEIILEINFIDKSDILNYKLEVEKKYLLINKKSKNLLKKNPFIINNIIKI